MLNFLHIGCGPKRKDQTTRSFNSPDWQETRLDIDPAVKPDLIGTMTDMSAVQSASMDALFSSHNIEHLYPHEVPVALKEFHRVLIGVLQTAGFSSGDSFLNCAAWSGPLQVSLSSPRASRLGGFCVPG